MPLGSSSAAPVISPGPIRAKGCCFTRRQMAASDFARRGSLSVFLVGGTAPHPHENQRQTASPTGLPAVHRNQRVSEKFHIAAGQANCDSRASLIFSAIMIVGMLVFAVGRRGMTDASAT